MISLLPTETIEDHRGQARTEERVSSTNRQINTVQPNTHTLQNVTVVGGEDITKDADTRGCGHSEVTLSELDGPKITLSRSSRTQEKDKPLPALFFVVLDIKEHEVTCVWGFDIDKLLYVTIPAKVLLHRDLETCKVGKDADTKTDTIPTSSTQNEWYFFENFLGCILQNEINEWTTLVAKDGIRLPAKLVLGVFFEHVVLHVVSKFKASAGQFVPGDLRWILPLPDHSSLQSGQCFLDIFNQLPGGWTKSCWLKTVSMAEATIANFQRDIFVNTNHVMVVHLQASYTEVTQWTQTSSGPQRVLVSTTNAGVQSALLSGFRQLLIKVFGAPAVHKYTSENLPEYLELCRKFIYKLDQENDLPMNVAIPHSLRNIFEDITGDRVDVSILNKPANMKVNFRLKDTVLTICPEQVQEIISIHLEKIQQFLTSFKRNDGFCHFRSIIVFGELANCEFIRQFIQNSFPGLRIYHDTNAMVKGAGSIGSKTE